MNPFQRLSAAAGISKFGDGLVLVALPLYVAAVTHGSVLAVAAMTFAGRLPWLFSLAAGAYADRRPFRATMVRTDVVRFGLVAAVAAVMLLHVASLPLLLAAAFAIGVCDTAFSAAAANALPAVVGEDELGRASGRLFAVEAGAEQVAGPAAAGILYSINSVVPFAADAFSFLASAAFLRKLPAQPAPAADDAAGGPASLRDDMRVGLRFFAANRLVRTLTLMIGTWSFGQATVYSLQVLFFTRTLGLTPKVFGFVIAATAITNVIGGLLAERVWKACGTMPLLTIAGTVVPGSFTVAATTHSPAVAALCFTVESLVTPWVIVATGTLRMQAAPAEVRGKVMNLSRTFVIGGAAAGSLAAGPIAAAFGLRAPMLVGAALYLGALLVAFRPLGRAIHAHDAAAASASPVTASTPAGADVDHFDELVPALA